MRTKVSSSSPFGTLGDFEVLRELGRGGMGVVYEARQISLNRKVALKVLSGGFGLTGKAVTRFKREAEAAAKLHHTNIVPIYATGEEDGTYFYAMELIPGPSLDKVIKQTRHAGLGKSEEREVTTLTSSAERTVLDSQQLTTGSKDSAKESPNLLGGEASAADTTSSLGQGSGYFDTVARIIAEVADALDFAHKQGVIHRDIKPSNLLLSADGRLHINDFGLARMLEQPGMTISGEFLGSPAYMSPEQIAAGRLPLDHRTDIYSLGVVLYELLTLRQPFSGSSRDQVLAQIVQKEPKPPRAVNKKVPIDLETICVKAIEKDPDRRYQSAGAMAEDLRRFVNRFAISARRANILQRGLKWSRRHPALAAVSAFAVFAFAGATAFAIQAQRAAERVKVTERQKALDEVTIMAMEANFATAEKAIGRAEMLGAAPGETRLLRGLLAYHRGLFSEAIVHLKEATNQLSSSPAAYALLTMAYANNGDWQYGEQLLPEVYNSRPQTSLDYLMVGQSLCFFEPRRAIVLVDKGVELGAGAFSRLIRAKVLASLAQLSGTLEDTERARAEAEFANNLLGNTNAWAIATLATARLMEARFYEGRDEAKRHEILKLVQSQISALVSANAPVAGKWVSINFYDYIGDDAAYEREVQRCYRESPSASSVSAYAFLLFEKGESEQAYRILEEAGRRYPNYPFGISLCALADATGDVAKARSAYDQLPDSRGFFDSLYKPHHLLLLGYTKEALEEVIAAKGRFSFLFKYRDGWYEQLFSYYAGQIDSKTLIDRAGNSPWNLCQAHYGIGVVKLSEGKRTEAKQHFRECIKTRAHVWIEYWWARTLLKRLERDSNWPPWIGM